MIFDLNITVQVKEEGNSKLIEKKLQEELKKKSAQEGIQDKVSPDEFNFKFVKKSVDARHGMQKIILRYKAFTAEEAEKLEEKIIWKACAGDAKKVIIVGSGPAGLFAALKFLEHGIQPVIIERGKTTSERKRDIAAISTRGTVDGDSNYCFGEGGAGTFSDGKLYTRSDKRGNIGRIMHIFCEFGSDKKILTDSHAHIGTDRLPEIINSMREKIISLGGEFYFGMRCTDLIIEKSGAEKTVRGIRAVSVSPDGTGVQSTREFFGDAVFLATGHSAQDIYYLLAKAAPECLEAKTFAAGVRIEHPRELIDKIQYHYRGKNSNREHLSASLGAAEYRLVSQIEGRGVYTFCMCPGGFVVPSATGVQSLVLNGMSSAKRNSRWSNAAIVVETRPEDIPREFFEQAEKAGTEALAPLFFRNYLEHETFLHGDGVSQAAPAQLVMDFLGGRNSAKEKFPSVSYTPGVVPSRLDKWLPPQIAQRLKGGIKEFDKKMRGFICPEAVIMASETRTSTPVRILRNRDSFECTALKNLYPCGEGSGYSGGIVSSAMDGENAAARCISIFQKL